MSHAGCAISTAVKCGKFGKAQSLRRWLCLNKKELEIQDEIGGVAAGGGLKEKWLRPVTSQTGRNVESDNRGSIISTAPISPSGGRSGNGVKGYRGVKGRQGELEGKGKREKGKRGRGKGERRSRGRGTTPHSRGRRGPKGDPAVGNRVRARSYRREARGECPQPGVRGFCALLCLFVAMARG
jgi:hypothetical protein